MGINRVELLAVLDMVRPGLAAREVAEQSTSFLLLPDMIATFNDEVVIAHPVKLGIQGAVRGNEFRNLLAKLTDETVELAATENELTVTGRRATAGIAFQAEISAATDVAIAQVSEQPEWKKLPADFCEAVKFCLFSAGSDMNKPALACVHLTKAFAESCDNFRLTRRDFKFNGDVLLLAKIGAVLIKYAPTKWAETDGWLHFMNAVGTRFSCRTVDATYPDLSKLIVEGGTSVELPDGLGAVIDRAAVFMDNSQGHPYVTVTLTAKALEVSARGAVGWFKEKSRIAYAGDPVTFSIVPQFLLDMLPILTSVAVCDGRLVFSGEGFVHVATIVAVEDKKK